MLLTDIKREALNRYIDTRMAKTTIRRRVSDLKSPYIAANELSLFCRMLRLCGPGSLQGHCAEL
jgi:hypothetical protein